MVKWLLLFVLGCAAETVEIPSGECVQTSDRCYQCSDKATAMKHNPMNTCVQKDAELCCTDYGCCMK